MKTWRNLGSFRRDGLNRPYVTVGFFDGVHRGHRAMLSELQEMADLGGGNAVVITFDVPAPRDPWQAENLTSTGEKLAKLDETDINGVLLLNLDETLKRLSPAEFVERFMVKGLGAAGVCVGYDHRFGRDGAGDFSLLAAKGKEHGYEVRAAAPLAVEGRIVSSTFIRRKVREGNVRDAGRLLGYRYTVEGVVEKGAGIGAAKLGYPTANLAILPKLVPAYGVYAAISYVKGRENKKKVAESEALPTEGVDAAFEGPYGTLLNIGTRPTFGRARRPSIEAHLFDFEGDLTGCYLRVFFVKRIRDEVKFADAAALKKQLADDEEKARIILSARGENPGE